MAKQSSKPSQHNATIPQGVPSPGLVRALKHLLKPLVRLLLSNGITLPYLNHLLKQLYIDVADKEFCLDEKKQTDSRISLLTGIHRKDTRRLREQVNQEDNQEDNSIPENISVSSQIIARWLAFPEYLDDTGQPRPLDKKIDNKNSSSSTEADFESLVKSISKQDIRPRVVLDEWLHQGIVSINQNNQVVLNTQAFVPHNSFEDKAFYFGQNLHDHIAATGHNLLAQQPPFFERSVYYNGLSQPSVQALDQLSRDLGMEALKRINQRAMDLQQQDMHLEHDLARINFGIYFFSESDDPNHDQKEDKLKTEHQTGTGE